MSLDLAASKLPLRVVFGRPFQKSIAKDILESFLFVSLKNRVQCGAVIQPTTDHRPSPTLWSPRESKPKSFGIVYHAAQVS